MQTYSRMSVPALVGASVVAGLSFLAGCGSGSDDANAQTTRNQTVTPFIPQSDVQYIDAIVPHHEHALEMAEMELAKGTRPEVKAIAQTIMDAQMQEITLLKNVRQALTGQAEIPEPPTDPHMARDMMRMEEATGANVDAEFLDGMIPHHAEGISIAHRALPSIQRTDVRDNANMVVATQARETGEMQALRR
ncbi:MAG: DUF305 domain-containing protein [Fibrella sp.]|nr:DUF305 domain-containing protein [Armatimonadota bacterium]